MTAQEKIAYLIATKNELIGDAGRYWHCDPFTLSCLAQIDAEIAILEDDTLFGDEPLLGNPNVESKACLDYEMHCNFVEDCERQQDDLEARGVTYRTPLVNDEIPF